MQSVPLPRTLVRGVLAVALAIAAATAALAAPAGAAQAHWRPPVDARWQYQLQGSEDFPRTGGIDVDICAVPYGGGECVRPEVFDIDLYAASEVSGDNRTLNTAAVRAIHDRGARAICYVDAGSIETYRPDYRAFVRWDAAHGNTLIGKPFSVVFPDENYANVKNRQRGKDGRIYRGQRDFLLKMMERRTKKCVRAGFDAVEYDVVDTWEAPRRVTGWSIGARAQLAFNRGLARIAHRHGLAVGLKNDVSQIPQLVDHFDFAINEECFSYKGDCRNLRVFVRAGKPVFHVEYEQAPKRFCTRATSYGFNSIKKAKDFSLYARPYRPCR